MSQRYAGPWPGEAVAPASVSILGLAAVPQDGASHPEFGLRYAEAHLRGPVWQAWRRVGRDPSRNEGGVHLASAVTSAPSARPSLKALRVVDRLIAISVSFTSASECESSETRLTPASNRHSSMGARA